MLVGIVKSSPSGAVFHAYETFLKNVFRAVRLWIGVGNTEKSYNRSHERFF